MKLLFDANLSRKLVEQLADIFPHSAHVTTVGLDYATDHVVFHFAATNEFIIVSKDQDFHQMAFLSGPPPKVIWVRLGNCRTSEVERAIREAATTIRRFVEDPDTAFLVLARRAR